MKEEIEAMWPLSENYEYTAELGLRLRQALPAEWASHGQDLPLPQASGFLFWKHLEEESPDLLRETLPILLQDSPVHMQEEWRASLRPPLEKKKREDLPPPPDTISLWAPSTNYSARSEELWSWTEEAFPRRTLQKSSSADVSDLSRVHSGEYLQGLREISASSGCWVTPETEIPSGSWESLLDISGAAIDAALFSWRERSGEFLFALPGSHHAGHRTARGTCLVHHLGVAAERLRREPGISRVALLDLDAHHGNGSEEIFFARDDIPTVSVHQENPFFPGTGSRESRGSGRGSGKNHNIPLSPDEPWIEGVREAEKILRSLSPDILLVQFGGDAHWADDASDLCATFDHFQEAGQMLRDLRLPMLVELGASTNSFSWIGSLRAFARGLL